MERVDWSRQRLVTWLSQRFARIPHRLSFEIIEDKVNRDGDFWFAPVHATRDGKAINRDAAVLIYRNVEDEIFSEAGLNLICVPA